MLRVSPHNSTRGRYDSTGLRMILEWDAGSRADDADNDHAAEVFILDGPPVVQAAGDPGSAPTG